MQAAGCSAEQTNAQVEEEATDEKSHETLTF
jgi:hypothetical protein